MTGVQIQSVRLPYILLTVFAVIILQGVLIADGAFGAMLVAIWKHQFANGRPLYRIYTGLPIVDELLAMSVSFWTAVSTELPILRLQATMLCASADYGIPIEQSRCTWRNPCSFFNGI